MSFLIRLIVAVFVLAAPAAAQEDPWFPIDGLNDGLGQPPDAVDRRTPRASVASFLTAAEAGRFDDAAHLLDLSDIAADAQETEGPILARQLHSVIERKAVLDWGRLTDRPDGLQVLGGQSEAQAGEPRRSFLIRELDLDPVPASIRLNRVKPGEGADPVWVFPRETVADLPALYEEYGPSTFESRLPPAMLEEGFWGLMWWELLGLPLLAAAACALGWAMHRVLDAIRRASGNGMARGIVRALDAPAIVVAVTALVHVVTDRLFVFSGQIDTILSPLLAVGYVVATLLVIVNGVEAILDNLIAPDEDIDLTGAEMDEARATATKLNAGKRILTIAVFLIGAGVVLTTADVFRGLGLSLLASAGALTVVLGFAARDILANIMASLQIAMNQSARVGDRVMYKDQLCYVERINLTYVQLRNWDDTRVVVPVTEFVSETFANWSLGSPAMLKILKFKLTPQTDLDALRDRFHRIMREMKDDPDYAEDMDDIDDASMVVTGQDVFGIDVWFSVPCTSPNTSWDVACEARERIVRAARDMEGERGTPVFPDANAAEAA